MTTRAIRDNDLFKEIKAILGNWYTIPNETGYGGSGAPGRLLEDVLHIQANNQDLPDAGRWELKYTSDTSYLTLFHKDPMPREPSVVKALVQNCGWKGRSGHLSFRHTIWGMSRRNFRVIVDNEKITVQNLEHPNIVPGWDIDDLNNSAVSKLRNLFVIFGEKRKKGKIRQVLFKVALAYSGFKFSEFKKGLAEGWICIDFDARTTPTGAIRNHGTKFRIRTRDVALLYAKTKRVMPDETKPKSK